jgi:hypothetical protein
MAKPRCSNSFPVTPPPSQHVSLDLILRGERAIAHCKCLWAQATAMIEENHGIDRENGRIRHGSGAGASEET